MKSVFFLISLFAAAWVFYDAKSRGKGDAVALIWCLGTQLLLIAFVPLWLYFRPDKYHNVVVIERPMRCAHCGK